MNIKQLSALIGLLKTNKIVSLVDWDMQHNDYQFDIVLDNFTQFSLPPISFNDNSKTKMLLDYNDQVGANKLLCQDYLQDYLIETLIGCEQLYYAANKGHYEEPWFKEAELDFINYTGNNDG